MSGENEKTLFFSFLEYFEKMGKDSGYYNNNDNDNNNKVYVCSDEEEAPAVPRSDIGL